MNKNDLLYAYLAGIVDGEGTLRIVKSCETKGKNRHNPTYNAGIYVVNTDKAIIKLLRDTFTPNCKIWIENRTINNPNHRIVYKWGTWGKNKVLFILTKLYPYLRIKKRQAKLLISFCDNFL